MFNDLDKNRNGRYQLSNLVIGNSIEDTAVEGACHYPSNKLLLLPTGLNDPNQQQRQVQRVTLQLPVVPFAQLESFH